MPQPQESITLFKQGSHRWLPPEIIDTSLFDEAYRPARDIYSFACTVIEIYTGKPPFSNIRTEVGVISEVIIHKRMPLRPTVEELPSDELWEVLVRCLARDARDRPTASNLLQSMRKINDFARTWDTLSLDEANNRNAVLTRIKSQFGSSSPMVWRTIGSVPPDVALSVMNILQAELDDWSTIEPYRSLYLKCLRVLGKKYAIVPDSFFCREVKREGNNPIGGGGFGDIWKGTLGPSQTPVCLKVLRVFGNNFDETLKGFCHETLLWRQLRHPRLLPFFGVADDLFPHRFCLVSPWMNNGTITAFLIKNPTHDRFQSLLEIAEGITYLHTIDPQIVHADIRGSNILVSDQGRCLLGDFGISVMMETQAPGSATRQRGAIRWMAPEVMDESVYNPLPFSARDIYSFGCTIIEIYTGKPPFRHLKTDAAVISKVLQRQPHPRPPLEQFPSDELWDFVMSCLSSYSKNRPTATDLLELLHSLDLTRVAPRS